MILAIGEQQLYISVAIEIVLMDPLQYTFSGHVKILSAVTKCALAESFKTVSGPNISRGLPFGWICAASDHIFFSHTRVSHFVRIYMVNSDH